MNKLLFVTSSLMAENSKSSQIAAEYVATAKATDPGLLVVERHLTPERMPHLSAGTLGALGLTPEERTVEQQEVVAFADGVIEEVEAADTILLAVPMYNLTIPSTVKAWLDHLARAGRTFRYTASGPQGLLAGKRVIVFASRGGFYAGDVPARPLDFQEPYLRAFFSFLGITDVTFVHIEGQAVSPEAATQGIAAARAAAGEIVRALAA